MLEYDWNVYVIFFFVLLPLKLLKNYVCLAREKSWEIGILISVRRLITNNLFNIWYSITTHLPNSNLYQVTIADCVDFHILRLSYASPHHFHCVELRQLLDLQLWCQLHTTSFIHKTLKQDFCNQRNFAINWINIERAIY